MRVLSVQQPYAQLIVRGIKRLEARAWDPRYTGRIAIHAAVNIAVKELRAEWDLNRSMAKSFGDQGWLDTDDLKALPRGAIVGTVELLGAQKGLRGKDGPGNLFAWNSYARRYEFADRHPKTGKVRRLRPTVAPIKVVARSTDVVWVLRKPVEIEPITDIAGERWLWTLEESIASEVEARAARTASGEWKRPPIDRARRRESHKRFRAQWRARLELEIREIEAEVRHALDVQAHEFSGGVERRFQQTFKRYLTEHLVVEKDGTEMVRVDRKMRRAIRSGNLLPRETFELELRRYIKSEAARVEKEQKDDLRRRKLMHMLMDLRDHRRAEATEDERREMVAEELSRMLFHADRNEDEGDGWKRFRGDGLTERDGFTSGADEEDDDDEFATGWGWE